MNDPADTSHPLTHARLFAAFRFPGLEASTCQGRLRVEWERTSPETTHGPTHQVRLHVCEACGARLPVDLDDRRILNSYREPADVVHQLAAAIRAGSTHGTA